MFHEFDRTAKPNVGRVTIRRLNRTEYNNTIRDLVGVDFKPAEDFPADDVGYGFDNIGDVLSVSPLLLEKYLSAAEIDPRADHRDYRPAQASASRRSMCLKQTNSRTRPTRWAELSPLRKGIMSSAARLPPTRPAMSLSRRGCAAGGKTVKEFEIKGPADKSTMQEAKVRMKQGTVRVAVTLLNPTTNPAEGAPKRAIYVRSLEIEGPFDPPPPPQVRSVQTAHGPQGRPTAPRGRPGDRHAVRDPRVPPSRAAGGGGGVPGLVRCERKEGPPLRAVRPRGALSRDGVAALFVPRRARSAQHCRRARPT